MPEAEAEASEDKPNAIVEVISQETNLKSLVSNPNSCQSKGIKKCLKTSHAPLKLEHTTKTSLHSKMSPTMSTLPDVDC